MPENYAHALGRRLRAIRQQQGLSLQGVEEKSRGKWKAVVVGSYERGDRAVTVQRLSELAAFYGVPLAELIPGAGQFDAASEAPPKLVLDLERLAELDVEEAAPLARFTGTIQAQRGDYNGRVLSIRQDDLRTLAVIYGEAPSQVAERMLTWGVLRPAAELGLRAGRDGAGDRRSDERMPRDRAGPDGERRSPNRPSGPR